MDDARFAEYDKFIRGGLEKAKTAEAFRLAGKLHDDLTQECLEDGSWERFQDKSAALTEQFFLKYLDFCSTPHQMNLLLPRINGVLEEAVGLERFQRIREHYARRWDKICNRTE